MAPRGGKICRASTEINETAPSEQVGYTRSDSVRLLVCRLNYHTTTPATTITPAVWWTRVIRRRRQDDCTAH
ncbi:hypothetical protein FRAAL4651 [Frankia alni ACN14a]|uniref:Uncharacterized protein n=1 Tax=Frankia alni (strain DSM 45986 / CECT 9034 / ACN14a) TaxID=326424 RepID=Q0RGU3_FRAAA|nr:hypothetical protein FRAAL4651 [Frankia alni ACN14a]